MGEPKEVNPVGFRFLNVGRPSNSGLWRKSVYNELNLHSEEPIEYSNESVDGNIWDGNWSVVGSGESEQRRKKWSLKPERSDWNSERRILYL